MRRSAIYAGTFDPLTLGHYDVIERIASIFEHVVVAVVEHAARKVPMFTAEERVAMARRSVGDFANVTVESFDELLVEYARRKGIYILVRGLRAYADFEYEFQMALTNRKLAPEIETLFLMPKEAYSYVSSSTVREIAERGGDTRDFVPAAVQAFIEAKFRPPSRGR